MESFFKKFIARFLRLQPILSRWWQEPLIPTVLLLVAGSLWGFLSLSDEVVGKDPHRIDRTILLAMREPGDSSDPLGPRMVEEMARDVTALGSFIVLTCLTLAAAGAALVVGKQRLAVITLASIVGGMVLMNALKHGFDRPRPDLVAHETWTTSSSFPSGHSMMAAVVYLTLGIALARTQRRRKLRIYLIGLSVAATILVGMSRIYLGVHWPSDVLGGWTVGATWALVFWLVAMRVDPQNTA